MVIDVCNFARKGTSDDDRAVGCGITYTYAGGLRHCSGQNNCILYQTYLAKYMNVDTIQSEFDNALSEISARKTELRELTHEIERLKTEKANIVAEDFLKVSIGANNYNMLMRIGFFDVTIKKSTYRIFKDGKIVKYTKSVFGQREEWKGMIKGDNVPLLDGIATVYYHIINDSDVFDKEKKCGQIKIEV